MEMESDIQFGVTFFAIKLCGPSCWGIETFTLTPRCPYVRSESSLPYPFWGA